MGGRRGNSGRGARFFGCSSSSSSKVKSGGISRPEKNWVEGRVGFRILCENDPERCDCDRCVIVAKAAGRGSPPGGEEEDCVVVKEASVRSVRENAIAEATQRER